MEEHTEDSTVFFFDTRRNEKNEMENKEYFIDMKGKNEDHGNTDTIIGIAKIDHEIDDNENCDHVDDVDDNNNDEDDENNICRVCHENVTLFDRTVISPCDCSGTVAFIHARCLARQVQYSNSYYCGTCNARFHIPPSLNAIRLRKWEEYLGYLILKCFKIRLLFFGHFLLYPWLFFLIYQLWTGEPQFFFLRIMYFFFLQKYITKLHALSFHIKGLTYAHAIKELVHGALNFSIEYSLKCVFEIGLVYGLFEILLKITSSIGLVTYLCESWGFTNESVVFIVIIISLYCRQQKSKQGSEFFSLIDFHIFDNLYYYGSSFPSPLDNTYPIESFMRDYASAEEVVVVEDFASIPRFVPRFD